MSVSGKKYSQVSKALIDQFNTAIPMIQRNQKKIQDLQKKDSSVSLEVELKIKNLGLTEFYRILDFVSSNDNFLPVDETKSTDYMINKNRYTVTEGSSEIIQTTKTPLDKDNNIDNDIWNLRLSLNIEVFSQAKINKKDLVNASLSRQKQRKSFTHKDGYYRIDMTYVITRKPREAPSYSYECEIEFLVVVDTNSITNASLMLADIWNAKQASKIAYTEKEKGDMIEKLNFSLKNVSGNRNSLDHTFMAPARNLKYLDVVYGGLIGGKVKYTGTIKADGERKQFLIFNGGFWLVYPPYDFNLLARSNSEQILKLNGFMVDGEDVPLAKRKASSITSNGSKASEVKITTEHMYIPFDLCLYPVNGNISNKVQEKPHKDRLKLARSITDEIDLKPIGLTFVNKDFIPINDNFESLSQVIRQLQQQIVNAEYETDGMVFTPNNAIYNTLTDTLPINKRILTEHADICKLKPWDHQTIDLLVDKSKSSDSRPATLMGRGRSNVIVPFEGSFYNTFDQDTQVQWDNDLIEQTPSGIVVEFEPERIDISVTIAECEYISTKKSCSQKEKESFSSSNAILPGNIEIGENILIRLVPRQIRANKPLPNRTDYAGSIWDDINDPLEEKTLLGETFRLLRHSFNRIKKKLYEQIPDEAILFEIGTGNGGQMSKWLRFSKILGIEPDSEHIKEMWTRLESFDNKNKEASNYEPLKDRVNVVEGGGEETEKILSAAKKWFGWETASSKSKLTKKTKSKEDIKPFYIVSMLSLSFFWKNVEMLNGLISTIQQLTTEYRRAGGKEVYFVFMTIEGHKVIDLFNNNTNTIDKNNVKKITLGPCQMDLNISEEFPSLEINITDSIVTNQTEYMVNLDDLKLQIPLKEMNIEPIEIEKCMSVSEHSYAKLFVSGVARIGLFSESIPLTQMSTSTSSSKIQGSRKSPSSPKNRSSSKSPSSPKGSSKESSSSSKGKTLPSKGGKDKSFVSRKTSSKQIPQPEGTNRINLRFTGRSDFLSRRVWNERRFHEDENKVISATQNEDFPAYKQLQFGFSIGSEKNKPVEWQSLGALFQKSKDEKDNDISIYSLPSLINAILTATYPDYQTMEDNVIKMEMCQQFFTDANEALSFKTKFPSETAQVLNPLVKGWLPLEELYDLAIDIMKNVGVIPMDLELEYVYYKGDNIRDVDIPEGLAEVETEVLEKYSSKAKSSSKYTTVSKMKGKSGYKDLKPLLDSHELDEWLIDDEKGFPEEVFKVKTTYAWIGDFESMEELCNSIDNQTYLKQLLHRDGVDTDSLFYNCRGGYLFRYYHANGWTLDTVKENLDINSKCRSLFQYAYFVDVLGIVIKTFAMPDEDDNNDGYVYFNPLFIKDTKVPTPNPDSVGRYKPNPDCVNISKTKGKYTKTIENDQIFTIMSRNFCISKEKFSFYPTARTDDSRKVNYYQKLWFNRNAGDVNTAVDLAGGIASFEFWGGYGDPNWGNKSPNKRMTTVYVYYHHFDPRHHGSAGESWWEDKDTHFEEEITFVDDKNGNQGLITTDREGELIPLYGIFIPLGQVMNDGLIKTIFNE